MSLDITDFSFLRTNALFSNTKSGSCRYYSEFRDKPARLWEVVKMNFLAVDYRVLIAVVPFLNYDISTFPHIPSAI
jgi:hypothetical protein